MFDLVGAMRQLYALQCDWSGWQGEPILNSALWKKRFESAADLAPTQPKQPEILLHLARE
jgi:hypothetical protein